jgi:hypothetical protein
MRVSELLEQDDFKRAKIQIIGFWKTDRGEFAILGPRGVPVFPINLALQHPIKIELDDRDPYLHPAEISSIRRRFGLDRPEFQKP